MDVESAFGIGTCSLREALRIRIAARWWAEIGVDPEAEPVTRQLLRALTHDALLALGHKGRVTSHLGTGSDRRVYAWERESFVEESWPLLVDLVRPALRLLKRAGPGGRPDHVLMVGEGSRIPGLRRAVAVLLGVDPLRDDAWIDAAGRGAAWLGTARLQPDHPGLKPQLSLPREAKAPTAEPEGPTDDAGPPTLTRQRATLGLADGGEVRAVRVREVTTLTLGMLVLQADRAERVVELIPAGTPLPARFRGRFVYAYDNMTSVRVEVTEGRGNTREQVRVIGTVALTGLPPRPRGTPIEVTYLYGEDQILAVEVTDLHSGRAVKADLVFRGALSADHREAARSRASETHVG
jgi:molecular chaperone DnaK (HSP70)